MEKMKVAWFSAGVSSFLACYYSKPDKIIYIHIDDQQNDTLRFLKDCEKFLGQEIEILQSRYKNVENVINQFNFIRRGTFGICTDVLKKRVRKEWEDKHRDFDITYVWGFDCNETERVFNTRMGMENYKHEFPLVEKQLRKKDVHQISKMLGIKRPLMYDLGYSNNNCLGCVKGGMGYWNKIRVDFPEVFKKRAEIERKIGISCIVSKGEQIFLDELDPKRGRFEKEIMEDCGIICQMKL